jgi:cell division protein FtsZ
MREMGDAVMGSGLGKGDNRAVEAAHLAISSPLLDDVNIAGAQGVLVNITGGSSLALMEVEEATEIIHQAAGEEANVILGAVVDESMGEEIMVTVIATGFNRRPAPSQTVRVSRPVKVVEKIPTGAEELQVLDEPAYIRRSGGQIPFAPLQGGSDSLREVREKIDKSDSEKPAFLRKVMD